MAANPKPRHYIRTPYIRPPCPEAEPQTRTLQSDTQYMTSHHHGHLKIGVVQHNSQYTTTYQGAESQV